MLDIFSLTNLVIIVMAIIMSIIGADERVKYLSESKYMNYKQAWKPFLILLFSYSLSSQVSADDSSNPCGGPNALLAVVNRPSNADSACVAPYKKVVVELGYQFQQLVNRGYQHNAPSAAVRVGAPSNSELEMLLPNYQYQTVAPRSGFSGVTIGFKHEFAYTDKWVLTMEGLLSPPSGGSAFGNQGVGGTVNGIVSYNLTSVLSVTGQLGVATQTLPSLVGGQRYNSINPDVVLSWTPKDQLEIFGEVYGQSKTSPRQGAGFNVDAGFIYLLTKYMTVDLEAGQRISGTLGGFSHYFGTGMAILF